MFYWIWYPDIIIQFNDPNPEHPPRREGGSYFRNSIFPRGRIPAGVATPRGPPQDRINDNHGFPQYSFKFRSHAKNRKKHCGNKLPAAGSAETE